MHSVVIYYKDANGNLQHYSLCFISDDNTHHTSFFTRFRHYWWNSWRRGFWTAQRSITFQMVVVGNIKISRTFLIYVPIKRTFPSKQSGFSLQVATGNQCVMELVVGWNVMLQNKVCRDHSTTILHAVLEVCQEEMKSFIFLALTKKTWSRWERRWRRGLKMVRRYLVQKAVLTSCPTQLHKLDTNCSEDESFVNIHDFKIPTWGDIGNIAPLYYISCVYNWLWWAGLVKKVDEEQGDVDVQFMQPPTPHGPQKTLNWPQGGDSCYVPIKNIAFTIQAPTTSFLDERKFKLCRTYRKRKFSFSNSATYFFEAWLSHTQI